MEKKDFSISTRRSLKYDFTEEEMKNLGSELASKNQELRDLENQKKSVVADFASRMTIAKEMIGSLSDKVASGYEMRDVNCEVEYHVPEKNKKTLTRTDINYSWVEPMTETDFNLWNQYEENKAEEESEEEEIDEAPTVQEENETEQEEQKVKKGKAA